MAEIGKTARVGWDYVPSRPDELALEEGDLLTITNVTDGGWWEGELNGTVGWFPASYVEVLTDEEAQRAFQEVSMSISADGLDSEKNVQWYNQYKNKNSMAIDEPEPQEERKVSGRAPRVVLAAPTEAKPKWFDKVDGKILSALSEKEKKRQEVIFELIQTEKDFVRDLDIIITVFLEPLRKKKIVNAKDLAILFSNVEQLVPVNMELLRCLETRRAENPVVELVGDVFLRLADYFKMYNMYCSNHPFSLVKYQNITTKAFKAFVAEAFQKPECRGLDMCSFLIKPVQRICKYPLLIREMLKFTDEKHKDFKNLDAAYERLEMVVTIVNEAIRQAEAVQRMLNIQARFSEKVNFLSPSRRLLRDEQLVQISDGKKKTRTVFLFTDLFVIAKEAGIMSSGDKLKVVDMVTLDAALIHDPEPESLNFQLTHSGIANYIFNAESQEAKKKWMEQLEELAHEEFERKQMELENESDDEDEDMLEELPEEQPKLTKGKDSHSSKESITISRESISGPVPAKPSTPEPPKAAPAEQPKRTASAAAKFKAEAQAAREAPAPAPAKNSEAFPGTAPGSARNSAASARVSGTPRSGPTPEPVETPPTRLSFRKPASTAPGDKPPAATDDRSNEAQAALNKMRMKRTASEPPKPIGSTSVDDATPEFLKIKNGLRKTVYEEEQQKQTPAPAQQAAPVSRKNQIRPRSKSAGALDEAFKEEKLKEEKKKSGGFLSNFLDMFRKKPKKGKETPEPAEGSKRSSSSSTVVTSSSSKTSASSPPSKTSASSPPSKGTLASPPSTSNVRNAASQINKNEAQRASTVQTRTPQAGGAQARPNQGARQPAKRLSTISASNAAAAGKVISVAVKAFKKVPGKDEYLFTVEVVREKATYGLQKSFDDFYSFHTSLIFQFPEEAGRRSQRRTLPDLPLQTVFVSESIAAQRRMELDRYLKKLFQLPEKISASASVLKFLEPKEGGGSSAPASSFSSGGGSAGFRASTAPSASTAAPSASFASASARFSNAPGSAPGAGAGPKPYREKTLPRPKPQAPRQPPPKMPASKNPAARVSKA